MTTDQNALDDSTNTQGTADDFVPDNDPMLAGLKEEESAGANAEGEEGNGWEPAQQQENKAETQQQPAAKADDDAGKSQPMIPKARLDEVLRENAQLKDAVTYKDGIIHTQKSMLEGKAPQAGTEGKEEGKTTEAQQADDPDAKIAKAEDEIIVLARKYEDGEISLVEFETGKRDLNRQIRELSTEQASSAAEVAKTTAAAVVSASQRQQKIEQQAVVIQKEHPYVEEIDKLPAPVAKGIWDMISAEADKNLADRGVNPKDPANRVAVIKERAVLTDKYGPQYTGKQIGSQTPTGKPVLSEKAQQRSDKLEIASQQPPVTSQLSYGADRAALTEQDIENMTDDQLADFEAQNPGLLEKITGLKK